MNRNIVPWYLTVLLAPALIQCISVIGPRILRPHGPYRVAIAEGPRTHSLYVAIEGRRENGKQFTQSREVQLPSESSRIIDLEIGDIGPGNYSLVARSTSGPKFSSSAPLVYQARSFCVFIQTDKRVYQPGDTINFRVIALDKYLLPLAGVVDVSVLDSGGTAVRTWVDNTLDRGLFTADLPLDTEPALGEWTLKAELRGQTYTQKVLVADYVMPKFNIVLDTPKQVLFSEGKFNLNITAKHFNGNPVRGELTVAVYAVFFSAVLQPVFSSPNRKVINFDGNTQITYDLKTDLDLAEDAARPLVIEAVLEEKNTLIKQNVTTRILLLRTPYRLRVTAPEFFKPSLPYYVQIEVVSPSGALTNDDGEVSVERLWDDGAPVNVTTVSLKGGIAVYSFIPDLAHANSTLNILLKYKGVTSRVVNIRRNFGARGQHLSVELVSRNVAVGGQIRARVLATEPMDLLHYAVLARGEIVLAKTVELSPARKNVDFSIPVSTSMSPGIILLAWYPRLDASSNDVLASSIYAPVEKLLQHEVSISVAKGSYRPGGSVLLKVTAGSGANAALLGEDEKAIQAGLAGADGLGSGLTLQMVEREVESFSGLSHSVFKDEDHQPGLGRDLGGNTTADIFHNSGVVILSDGVINRHTESPPITESGSRPPLAGPYAFSRIPPPPAPRYYLSVNPQATWMLATVSLNDDGTGGINRVTPMSLGKWSIGAFAVHPTLGLGLAAPKSITTSKTLDITAELPSTLQRGETLAAVITLNSALTVDTTVEITFHNSEQYFEFEPLENDLDANKKVELFRRLKVTVPAEGSASTAFLVTAVRSGEAPIIIEASGNGISASFFRTIDVQDGYEEELWSWSLLDARRGIARSNITLSAVAGTKLGTASLRATGDLLAPALYAARKMTSSAGDPAHALRPLAVACVLLQYLQKADHDEPAIQSEMLAQAAAGYQRLIAYRRKDGSFSTERKANGAGDVWMTAMATPWLSRAGRYVSVSSDAAINAAQWLAAAQNQDGSWTPPPARLRHNQRAQQPIPLTAHVLLAILKLQGARVLFKNVIDKAEDYIAKAVTDQLDAYSLSVAASALAAVSNPQSTFALHSLDLHANVTDNMRWWRRQISGNEWRNPWLRGNSADAATAAWGLRAMLAARLVDEAIPVARYLLSAYSPSDLDPDVLEALAELAESIKSPTKLRASVTVPGSEEARQFNIDGDNSLIIQTQLVRNVRNASAVTEGRGLALIGLSAPAATNVTVAWPRYTLDPRVDAVSTKHRLQLSVCIGFVVQGNETISGFTLLTIQLPSGYVADINTLTELTAANHVTRARLSHGGTRINAWLKPLDSRERCATLAAPRAVPVARQRPGYATLVDLYDSSHRARVFFNAIPAHACDICRVWESCSRVCGAASSQRSPGDYDDEEEKPRKNANRNIANITLLAAILFTFFSK